VSDYSQLYKSLPAREFPVQQDAAMEHFNRLGFPTPKDEEWKYTNVNPIASRNFSFAGSKAKISREEIFHRFPFLNDSFFVVIENGKWNMNASLINNLPQGVEIKNLRDEKNNPLVQQHFNEYADVQADAFAALNTAFANDALLIHFHPGTILEKQLCLVHISSSQEEAVVSHSRLLVLSEKNSSAKISAVFVSQSETAETFVNSINEIFVAENASLEFDLLQNENEKSFQVCGTHVYQSTHSRFSINTITLGGHIVKNKLHIKLDGTQCENHMHGLYLADGSQLIDNHTAVYHTKPHSNSNQLYKGIIGGKAHGVFNGKIFVEKDAQKTNAYQSNKNILLSNDAVINAKPQLEIFADDVKCTHGATTGQMDEEALFYLRSRGINEAPAKALLNLAFANDILNNISMEDFRVYLSSVVEYKLKESFLK